MTEILHLHHRAHKVAERFPTHIV